MGPDTRDYSTSACYIQPLVLAPSKVRLSSSGVKAKPHRSTFLEPALGSGGVKKAEGHRFLESTWFRLGSCCGSPTINGPTLYMSKQAGKHFLKALSSLHLAATSPANHLNGIPRESRSLSRKDGKSEGQVGICPVGSSPEVEKTNQQVLLTHEQEGPVLSNHYLPTQSQVLRCMR